MTDPTLPPNPEDRDRIGGMGFGDDLGEEEIGAGAARTGGSGVRDYLKWGREVSTSRKQVEKLDKALQSLGTKGFPSFDKALDTSVKKVQKIREETKGFADEVDRVSSRSAGGNAGDWTMATPPPSEATTASPSVAAAAATSVGAPTVTQSTASTPVNTNTPGVGVGTGMMVGAMATRTGQGPITENPTEVASAEVGQPGLVARYGPTLAVGGAAMGIRAGAQRAGEKRPGIVSMEQFAQTSAMAEGASMRGVRGEMIGQIRGGAAFGAFGLSDYMAGQEAVRGMAPGAEMGSAQFQGAQANVTGLATLQPGIGQAQAGAQARGLFSPQVARQFEARGHLIRPGGETRDINEVFRIIEQELFGGREPTPAEIMAAVEPGSTGYTTLQALTGGDESLIQAWREHRLADLRLGSTQFDITNQAHFERAGMSETLGFSDAATAEARIRTGAEQVPGEAETHRVMNEFRQAVSDSTQGLGAFNQALGASNALMGQFGNMASTAIGVIAAQLAMGGGGGGVVGKAGKAARTGTTALGAAAGAGGLKGALALGGLTAGAVGLAVGGAWTAGQASGATRQVGESLEESPSFWTQALGRGVQGISQGIDVAVPGATLFGSGSGSWGTGSWWSDRGKDTGDPFEGLHPEMQSKVGRMMADNPNIQINDGRRSRAEQTSLHEDRQGSDKPYAAPPGTSKHEEGVAADIGPRSEYPWIAANAAKYGLDQPAPNEPWHLELPTARGDHEKQRVRELNRTDKVWGGGHEGERKQGFGGVKPWVAQVGHHVKSKFGVRDIGGVGQRSGKSDHPSGHALDFMTYQDQSKGDRITRYLERNWDHFSLKYLIWKQRIKNSKAAGWRRMEDRGSDTANHMDHPHASFLASPTEGDYRGGEGEAEEADDPQKKTRSGGSSRKLTDQWGSAEEADVISRLLGGGTANTGTAVATEEDVEEDASESDPNISGEGAELAAKAGRSAGMTGSHLTTMVAIAGPESGYDPRAHNPNAATGDNSYGLWQINMIGSMGPSRRRQFEISSNEELFNPATNARAAQSVFGSQGYRAWSVYKSGKHKAYMDVARQAVSDTGDPIDMMEEGSPEELGQYSYEPQSGASGVGVPLGKEEDVGDPLDLLPSSAPAQPVLVGASPASISAGPVRGQPSASPEAQILADSGDGRQGGGLTIQNLEMTVTLANGDRREVDKLFREIQSRSHQQTQVSSIMRGE